MENWNGKNLISSIYGGCMTLDKLLKVSELFFPYWRKEKSSNSLYGCMNWELHFQHALHSAKPLMSVQ